MTVYARYLGTLRDYLTSCLNALFKNDVTEYAKHTGEDESSVQSQLESSMYAPPEELSASYTERYSAALKAICNNCQYSVGTPKKQDGLFNYIIDVTVTPNTSFQSAMNELENGTYYSEEEVDRALVELMEKIRCCTNLWCTDNGYRFSELQNTVSGRCRRF